MDTIRKIPLFADLDDDRAAKLTRACGWKSHEANELVIDYEDESTDVRFILSGAVRVILRVAAGREMILAELKEGDHFGEIAAIDGASRSANVTAIEPARMCIMPGHVFREILNEDAAINLTILKELAGRIRSLNTRLSEHSFLQTRHRLYCELIRLSRPRAVDRTQRAISPPPVQKDLAARIGSRREIVSREIAQLKRDDIVETTTGALVIKNVDALNGMIHEAWEQV